MSSPPSLSTFQNTTTPALTSVVSLATQSIRAAGDAHNAIVRSLMQQVWHQKLQKKNDAIELSHEIASNIETVMKFTHPLTEKVSYALSLSGLQAIGINYHHFDISCVTPCLTASMDNRELVMVAVSIMGEDDASLIALASPHEINDAPDDDDEYGPPSRDSDDEKESNEEEDEEEASSDEDSAPLIGYEESPSPSPSPSPTSIPFNTHRFRTKYTNSSESGEEEASDSARGIGSEESVSQTKKGSTRKLGKNSQRRTKRGKKGKKEQKEQKEKKSKRRGKIAGKNLRPHKRQRAMKFVPSPSPSKAHPRT